MSKTRLLAALVLAASALVVGVLTAGAAAKPQQTSASAIKLGFITKFPVDFFFVLQNAAKGWDKKHSDASVVFAQGKSATDDAGEIAAIQDMVAKGVKGIAITPTSPAVSKELDKAIKKGVKVVLMDNDIPSWTYKFGSEGTAKDDLNHAFAAEYTCGNTTACTSHNAVGHKILMFGGDRWSNNGTANLAFWFFQHRV